MSIVAILQARASSSRLPNKVLKPILGIPMLQHQIERVKRSNFIDKLVVATSIEDPDNELVELLERLEVNVYRGSLDDVLDRFYCAAKEIQPVHVVRLTGDCPLADPTVIDHVIQCHLNSGADYTSNVNVPTYPDGLDVEVMTFAALESACKKATLCSEREHVTPYIRKAESNYVLQDVKASVDLSHLRWTVDEPEDFEFVSRVYESLYIKNHNFTTDEILLLLDRMPQLLSINQEFERNEGYTKSLLKD